MLTEISSAAAALKATIGIVSTLSETFKKLGKIAKKSEFIEIQEKLLAVKAQLLEHREKLQGIEQENQELKHKLKLSEELNFESPYYWLIKGSDREGPFCQRCYDIDSKPVRLIPNDPDELRFYCTACKSHYESLETTRKRRDNLFNQFGR
ncbi:MAG: hypothetical protein KBA81_04510 [Rhabdochlamydiaceae bacterium]|nr:hypothetical protein [Rhabdochlamydiaceae bacterium]